MGLARNRTLKWPTIPLVRFSFEFSAVLWGVSGQVSVPSGVTEAWHHHFQTHRGLDRSCAENVTGVLMDTRLNINQEHVLLSVKSTNTLGPINMMVVSRLKVLMILLLLSTSYAAFRILHPAFSSSLQRICLQTSGSSGEATEMMRAGELDLWGEAWEVGLGQPGPEKALGEPTI